MLALAKDLTKRDYDYVRKLVYDRSGIDLGDKKMQLVRSRLGKIVRERDVGSFQDYFRLVENDPTGKELGVLLDSITTNTTHLFREIQHFQLLAKLIHKWADDTTWRNQNNALRIWSAGCSSGDEPYSIAMTAHDALARHKGVGLKILATDLSTQMLQQAQRGTFEPIRIGTVPEKFQRRYLKKVSHKGGHAFQVVPEISQAITFSRFNLMTPTFPFKNRFNIIFCRNVMIYFDKKTQTELVNKYAGKLHLGGYLMIGHSESLNKMDHPLTYVKPTIYRKDA